MTAAASGVEIPRIISVDDHVIEPAHVWQEYLPAAFRDRGPRLIKVQGRLKFEPRHVAFQRDPNGYWADCWSYDGVLYPVTGGFAAVSFAREAMHNRGVLFEDILPGCYDRTARLADLDRNHTEASLCFPTFPALLRTDLSRAWRTRPRTGLRSGLQHLDAAGVVRR